MPVIVRITHQVAPGRLGLATTSLATGREDAGFRNIMKFSIAGTFIMLGLLACAWEQASAQYNWSVSFRQADDSTSRYTPISLSCAGNHCTAIDLAERKDASAWYEFLRSDDGGLTWQEQWRVRDYGSPGFFVFAMQQIDSLNVVAVGDSGHIFRTFDGGITWEKQSSAPYPIASIWGVNFYDSLNGIIGLPDRPMTTSDGGQNWTLGPYTALGSENCHCYGRGKFAVLNENTGVIHRTSDNWATIDSTLPFINDSMDLRGCDWGQGDTIIAYGFEVGAFTSGQQGLIERTTDAGRSWTKSMLPIGDAVTSMTPLTDDTILAGRADFGFNSFLVSFDGGQTWSTDSVAEISGLAKSPFDAVDAIARPSPGVVLAEVQNVQGSWGYGPILRGEVASADVLPAGNTIGIASVYPNPVSSIVTINFDYRRAPVRVVDILGREVLRAEMPLSG